MVNAKGFWKSKTFWVNVIAFAFAVLSGLGLVKELDPSLEQFVLPVIFLINLILRFVTNQAIKLR